jgi:DNA helicase IV
VVQDEVRLEQAYITRLYDRLDHLRTQARADLAGVRHQGVAGLTHQGRSERDARAALLENRLEQLEGVEEGLCFGRIDRTDRVALYVGRIGMSSREYDRLLVDWRAPAARPFYAATPKSPEGVVRRRHIRTRMRRVLGIEDDLLDLDEMTDGDHRHLAGEGALLAALGAGRTGHMRDIVATIQAEQDAVIRSDLAGVLVVDGGPGTGKTAVALHRAAYLLYEHRERLASRGVLVVGPGEVFLRYIERVLPSLGETGVVLSTVGRLFPGVRAEAIEPDEVAAVKGDVRMADVLAEAVRLRQQVPRSTVEIPYGRVVLTVERAAVMGWRTRARRARRPHNRSRGVFLREMLDALATQVAAATGRGPLDAEARSDLVSELREHEPVLAWLDEWWPVLRPQDLLSDLFGDPAAMRAASPRLGEAERRLLERPSGHPWTEADVPLLDELAELIGTVATADPALVAQRVEEAMEEGYASEMLAELDLPVPVDASLVAARYRGTPTRRSTADIASEDRAWTYGHVVVDEAQELSPMAWRMLARRAPSRSMTVVGDLAQASGPSSLRSWREALDPYAGDRWRSVELTVNYRTPAEIMAVAAGLLRVADPTASPPTAIRSVGEHPVAHRVSPSALPFAVADVVRHEVDAYDGGGSVGVIVPAVSQAAVADAVASEVPGASTSRVATLDSPAVVLTARAAKGLEFDTVVVVEPAAIAAERDRGRHDLYVALTRATRRLVVVHADDLPIGMRSLQSR